MRRRAERIARPARVRMRRRKPWVFARRRLFGWNVRLVTSHSIDDEAVGSGASDQVRTAETDDRNTHKACGVWARRRLATNSGWATLRDTPSSGQMRNFTQRTGVEAPRAPH